MYKNLILFLFMAFYAILFAYEPLFMETPTISPDGEQIAFVYRNDIWVVPFEGGVARRLTSTSGDVARPMYSSDGNWIYFVSDREGRFKLYRIPATGGTAELLSNEEFVIRDVFSDSDSVLGMVSYPGEPRIFVKFDVGNKRLTEISGFAGDTATIAKDGQKIVFSRYGDTHRPAYQGSLSGTLWLYDIEKNEYTNLSQSPFSYRYPRFSKVHPDRIYFAHSDGNQFQLFYMENFDYETKTQLTFFEQWSVRNLSVSNDTDRIVYELFSEIWSYDPQTEHNKKVDIEIREDNLPHTTIYQKNESELENFAVSPSGVLLVFSYKYDLFAIPMSGGEVRQLTFDQKGIYEVLILDDNETIYFLALVQGVQKLFVTNIKDHLPQSSKEPVMVAWSADKIIHNIRRNSQQDIFINFSRGDDRNKIAQLTQDGQIIELLFDQRFEAPLKTKDNSKLIYSSIDDARRITTLNVKNEITNQVEEIFISSSNVNPVLFDDEETYLFFTTWGKIQMVNLHNDRQIQEDNWDKIVPGSSTGDTPPTKEWDISKDNFRARNRNIVSENGWLVPLYATSDSTLFYVNWTMSSLNSINFDGSEKTEILKYGRNYSFSDFSLSADRKYFYYIKEDKLHKFIMSSKQDTAITFEHEYEYDEKKLNQTVFEEVWGDFGYSFYDADKHGQDWDEIFTKFSPFSKNITDVKHLKMVIDEMIGRLNASHTGFTPRTDGNEANREMALIGFIPDYRTVLPEGIGIKKIYFDSELYQKYGIRENVIILSINGQQINSNSEISPFFFGKVKQDISFQIQTPRGIVNATVKGISWSDQNSLRYEDMVLNNTRLVSEKTDGRIGYLHIRQMDWESLERFTEDFLAVNFQTDAMIIDVRANPGGRISDELIDIISRKPHSYHSWRVGRELIPNPLSYQKPLVVLIDERTGSDAEVFSILFSDLQLGKVIGMPTSGSVIGTRTWGLIDGSEMRMPFMGLYRLNFINMENTGAKPDIEIPLLPAHLVDREDPQLEKAIEELLSIIRQ